ncbi:hypothetical protein AB6A40_001593 [Gnathostoma spinigerum]|uniref:Ras-associating domain-containing protein n=1 Tax=Gnathostoma spinigerum TaxID=75299 RepID=A0ABD6EC13_9BILA
MELKVLMDGVERSVSGLTETTTCAQIIYALAHATGRKGKFVLVEKSHETERNLTSSERPLEILKNRGVYARTVTFVLKQLGIVTNTAQQSKTVITSPSVNSVLQTQSSGLLQFNDYSAYNTLRVDEPNEINESNRLSNAFASAGDSSFYSVNDLSASATLLKPSTSSAVRSTTAVGSLAYQKQSFSSVSLPCCSTTVGTNNIGKIRPPPPSYGDLIKMRHNTLRRGMNYHMLQPISFTDCGTDAQSMDSKMSITDADMRVHDLEWNRLDLESYVVNQRKIINGQKDRLLQLEASITDETQRELLQLKKQRENLHLVLDPLRAANLARELSAEKTALEQCQELIYHLESITRQNQELIDKQHRKISKLEEEIASVGSELSALIDTDAERLEETGDYDST